MISSVHVNHFITLLKLDPEVIGLVEEIGDPMPKRFVSERKLRSILKCQVKDKSENKQNQENSLIA